MQGLYNIFIYDILHMKHWLSTASHLLNPTYSALHCWMHLCRCTSLDKDMWVLKGLAECHWHLSTPPIPTQLQRSNISTINSCQWPYIHITNHEELISKEYPPRLVLFESQSQDIETNTIVLQYTTLKKPTTEWISIG